MKNLRTKLLIALVTAAPAFGIGSAHAQDPDCSNATLFPNPVYLAGSSAIEVMVKVFAVKVKSTATIIFQSIASCDGPNAIKNNTTLTGKASYYEVDPADATKVVIKKCSLDAAVTKADVGVADVTYKTCVGEARPATLGEWSGPVQAMLFAVPELNVTTTSISAQQGQSIWGCGAGSGTPFTDELAIQQRTQASGTQNMIAKYLGLSPAMMKGKMNASTTDMANSLAAVADPQKAIGFIAADGYESRRATLNALAFRGFDQTKAYYADSDANSTDKRNVRDGHYMIQGPLHLIAALDGSGQPSPKAKQLLDWLTGTVQVDSTNANSYIDIVAGVGNVPSCAMQVKRDDDGGFLKPYAPAVSCGCYFEAKATKAVPAGCTACTSNAGCASIAGTSCQTGYCEKIVD